MEKRRDFKKMDKNYLKTLKIKMRIFRNQVNWFYDKFLSKFIYNKNFINQNNILSNDLIENALILAPHADDEWVGCSQVIRKLKKTSVYYFNFLGNNYNEQNKKIRLNEITNVSENKNFELVVSSDSNDYSDLKTLLSEKKFSAIFIPFPIDWHPEHIKVNKIIFDILNNNFDNKNIFFYHVSVPISEFQENLFYLPLSKEEAKDKIKTFDKYYISQKNTPIRRFVLQNILWAQGQNFYAAEVYAKLSLEEWGELLNFVTDNFNEIKNTIHFLDAPYKIRQLSNNLYTKFKKS